MARIRYGFKGDYLLTVADTIPDNLRSKMATLNVTLNTQYFDRLPGQATLRYASIVSSDSVMQLIVGHNQLDYHQQGIHTYQLTIPPIMFDVTLSASSP